MTRNHALFPTIFYLLVSAAGGHAQESTLWGAHGEKWKPGAPLKDFSRAGYRENDAAIPDLPVGGNVRDFGAAGDGKTDDTAAFARAVAACPENSALFVPDGTYVLRDWLKINRRGLVLRGQSRERTVLFFPVGLGETHPNMGKTTTHLPTSNWSWTGGLIWFEDASEVGIEDFTLKFPSVPYPGHFKEAGFNGVYFYRCADGWARRLTFVNADSGIFAGKCARLTFRNFLFDADPGRAAPEGMSGHHGVDFSGSASCLMDGAVFRLRFFHELGVEPCQRAEFLHHGRRELPPHLGLRGVVRESLELFEDHETGDALALTSSWTPTVAHSATSGCPQIASSISRVPRRCPATLITSSERPRMKM